jgi:ATPase family AAA domain-containing protein 3A/B
LLDLFVLLNILLRQDNGCKKLASIIGIDCTLMSGGDVSPLGADAVTQIHNLFLWAKMSPKGVILFIDEAECFLGSRDSGIMSETAHNVLNALLYNTGGERKVRLTV